MEWNGIMEAVDRFGPSIAMGVASFVFMVWLVKSSLRESRAREQRLLGLVESDQKFIREDLADALVASASAQQAAATALNLLVAELRSRPCGQNLRED